MKFFLRIAALLAALIPAALSDGARAPAIAQNVICATPPVGDSSNRCASTAFVQQSTRIRLSAPLTIYIDNVNGSDSNNGLSAGSAFASYAKASAYLASSIDTNNQAVTIQAAAGQTWSNLFQLAGWVGGGAVTFDAGGGSIVGSGGSYALDVILESASNSFTVRNATFTCSGGGGGVVLGSSSHGLVVLGAGLTFGACPGGAQISIDGPGRLLAGSYTITGGANWHLLATVGLIDFNNSAATITITGTPAFAGAFAQASSLGNIISFVTWSGSATGTRWSAALNAVIQTNSTSCNSYFPGSANGVASEGGRCDTIGTPATTGTTTNDNAAAGNVGEYACATIGTDPQCAQQQGLANVAVDGSNHSNLISLPLLPGDYDVTANALFSGTSTSVGLIAFSFSLLSPSPTLDLSQVDGFVEINGVGMFNGPNVPTMALGPKRFSVAGTAITFTGNNINFTAHNLLANDPVIFGPLSGATMPTPLVVNTVYYVKTVTNANQFTLSATPGGSTITLGGSPANVVIGLTLRTVGYCGFNGGTCNATAKMRARRVR